MRDQNTDCKEEYTLQKARIICGIWTATINFKPFGFCIHGAIDGYSRRVMWLDVASTNSDLEIIGSYFIDYVSVV